MLLQDANPTPSFGGFGLRSGDVDTGASAAGMDVVQIYVAYSDEWRDANAQEWSGPRISKLHKVLKLVGV